MVKSARGVLRQIVNAIGLLLAVVVLNFTLIQAAPGDPAVVIAGEMGGASPKILADIRARYGLDRSKTEQLATYVGKVAKGDFGYSFYFNQPVLGLILQRLPATLLLILTSLFLSAGIGAFFGILTARHPDSILSNLISIVAIAGYSAPVFWTGLMLLVVFASAWPILPVTGMENVAVPRHGFALVLDVARHLVLPAATLAIVYVAQYSRLTHTSMVDVLQADYIRTARAKGLPERVVVLKHAFRNALIPLVTVIGLQFGQVFAGAVLVETVFGWPGLGRLVFESILRRDYPTLLGVLFFSALLVIVANLVTDLGLPDHRSAHPHGTRMTLADVATPQPLPTVPTDAPPARGTLRRLLGSPMGCLGTIIIVAILLAAALGPTLYPVDPFDIAGAPFTPPWGDPIFGTDYLGRDVLAGLLHGARATLSIGVVAALITIVIGVAIGSVAGFFGGWVDTLLMKITEFFQVLPTLLFAMVLVTLFGAKLSVVTFSIGIVSWPPVARLTRAEFLRIRGLDYIKASRAAGAGPIYLIWRVILPNAAPPIIVAATLAIGTAILFASGLSFLGLGDPNIMSWGLMIGESRQYALDAWWTVAMPGGAIFLAVVAVSLFGDAFNAALNPRSSKRG